MKAYKGLSLFALFLSLLFLCPTQPSVAGVADASIDAAHEFMGSWLLDVWGAKHRRLVIVEATKPADNGALVFTGKMGWADKKKRKPVKGGLIERIGQGYGLSFVLGGGRKILFSEESENRLEGLWKTRKGKKRFAVMTRADAAAVKFASIRMRPHSVIRVVYVGASDCPHCRYWEGAYEVAWKRSALYRKVTFNEIITASYSYTNDTFFWPADLKWMIAKGRFAHGTPRFVIVVDHRIVKSVRGVSNWEEVVVPMVQRLVDRKDRLAHSG